MKKIREITKNEIMDNLLLDSCLKSLITKETLSVIKGEIFNELYRDKLTQDQLNYKIKQYYDVLPSIYIMDRYSIIADYLLNRNKNILENAILDFKNMINILVNPDNFNNKKIVKMIRNAYTHNNVLEKNKFILYENKKYKINIMEGKFQAEFSFFDATKFSDYLLEQSRNSYYLNIEGCIDFDISHDIEKQIDEIFVDYYPLSTNFPDEVYTNLHKDNIDRSNKESVLAISKKNQDILENCLKKQIEKKGEIFDKKNYNYYLDEFQKERLKEIIEKLREEEDLLLPLEYHIPFYIMYSVQRVLPIPQVHFMRFEDCYYNLAECINLNVSHESVLNNIRDRVIKELNELLLISNENIDTRKLYSMYRYYLRMKDLDEMKKYALLNNSKYFLTNLYQEEFIIIDNKKYKVEKLRNSLVHFRWFFGSGDTVVFYDADPRHEKMYDFNYCEKINIYSLEDTCRKLYLKSIDK